MQNSRDQQVYAGFFVRLAAYFIDCIIVGAALMAIRIPVWFLSLGGAFGFLLDDFIFEYSVYDIVLYLLKVTYFVLLTYFTGSTLGKKLLQIQVVSAEGRKPSFFEIAFRESVGRFLSDFEASSSGSSKIMLGSAGSSSSSEKKTETKQICFNDISNQTEIDVEDTIIHIN